ncbi:hypothetical protein [Brevundimonas sp. TWP2-3-2]|uniref:hypothetical protein n=1 Tax=unclassified Brevundimonas TaxID=2622653 RepID=UPI003CE91B2E
MDRLIDKFRCADPAFRIEPVGDGVIIIRQDGQAELFNVLTRDIINSTGNEFLVLPTKDGHKGYERVFVLPL